MVGDGHGHADIGIVAVGGEGFRAVEHPPPSVRTAVVRVPPASEPASGSVSDQQPSFSPCARGTDVFLLLRVGAKFVDVIGAKRIVRRDDDADGAVHAGKFFDGDDIFDIAEPRAAVFFRENDAEQAELREFRDNFLREMRGFVPLHDVRSDFGFGEFADGAAKLLLFVGERKIQARLLGEKSEYLESNASTPRKLHSIQTSEPARDAQDRLANRLSHRRQVFPTARAEEYCIATLAQKC